jgi:hypothetical protein
MNTEVLVHVQQPDDKEEQIYQYLAKLEKNSSFVTMSRGFHGKLQQNVDAYVADTLKSNKSWLAQGGGRLVRKSAMELNWPSVLQAWITKCVLIKA